MVCGRLVFQPAVKQILPPTLIYCILLYFFCLASANQSLLNVEEILDSVRLGFELDIFRRIAVGQKLRCNVIEYRPDPSQPDQESNPVELSQRRKSAESSHKEQILIFSSKRNFRHPPGSKVTAYIASVSVNFRIFLSSGLGNT